MNEINFNTFSKERKEIIKSLRISNTKQSLNFNFNSQKNKLQEIY